jgi:NADH-quinone oxidoreductase subunit A
MLLNEYAPILIFVVLAAVFPLATLWILKLLRPNPQPSAEKLMPYECGITPESDSRGRYTVRFYLIAILFVIFDVETIFLFPWAVQYQVLGLFGLVEMLVFLGILIVGYVWIWKRGALEWISWGVAEVRCDQFCIDCGSLLPLFHPNLACGSGNASARASRRARFRAASRRTPEALRANCWCSSRRLNCCDTSLDSDLVSSP